MSFQMSPNHVLVFLPYHLLRWWALYTRNVIFTAFCGCERILGRKSTNICFSFISFCCLSICTNFLQWFFHVAFISVHAPFILRSFPSSHGFPPIFFVNTTAKKNKNIVSHGIYQLMNLKEPWPCPWKAEPTSTCSSKPIPEAFTSVARDRITTIRWDGILMIMRLYRLYGSIPS